jgi:hypothetical protein
MEDQVTPERIVAAAAELDRDEFTRAELAEELGASDKDFKDAFKAARRSGRLKRVGERDDGKKVFRLTGD